MVFYFDRYNGREYGPDEAWDSRVWTLAQYAGHVSSIIVYILSGWLIHAFFRTHTFPGLSKSAKQAVNIIVGIIACLIIHYFVMIYVPEKFLPRDIPLESTYFDFLRRLIMCFFLSMISYIVFNNIYANSILQNTQLENEHLKQAHLRGQLISLQQQISPHFLFNSLSTLKTIAQDTDTKTYVVQLAHVYRYLLNYNEHPATSLSNELSFIDSYLYILHWRFEEALKVSIDVPEKYNTYLIPPVSIQLLIENVIKHNAFSPEHPVHIKITVDDEGKLIITNTRQPKKVTYESTKLGLQNIKERFQLLFNKKIIINSTDQNFTVILPLISNEHYNH
jgi:two-component system, LytTR family, sensor kinase